ncbi:MAG: dockerin type I domain-containing protein, partial [Chloroflexota bacterium]
SNFYGEDPGGSQVFPRGNGRGENGEDLTPFPKGGNGDGYLKLYVNQGGLGQWSWDTSTNDEGAHQIYVEFDTPGVYTMEISARSFGHAIDRAVLFETGSVSVSDALNLNNAETLCGVSNVSNGVDTDNSGTVTPADAIFVINRVGENVNIANNIFADVNNDDVIDADDVTAVIQAIGTQP